MKRVYALSMTVGCTEIAPRQSSCPRDGVRWTARVACATIVSCSRRVGGDRCPGAWWIGIVVLAAGAVGACKGGSEPSIAATRVQTAETSRAPRSRRLGWNEPGRRRPGWNPSRATRPPAGPVMAPLSEMRRRRPALLRRQLVHGSRPCLRGASLRLYRLWRSRPAMLLEGSDLRLLRCLPQRRVPHLRTRGRRRHGMWQPRRALLLDRAGLPFRDDVFLRWREAGLLVVRRHRAALLLRRQLHGRRLLFPRQLRGRR